MDRASEVRRIPNPTCAVLDVVLLRADERDSVPRMVTSFGILPGGAWSNGSRGA